MTIRNLQLDTNGELVLANGNLTLVSDAASIQQAVQCQLRTFLGEWFLDSTTAPKVGVPYFQAVLIKGASPDLLRKLFSDAILAVRGVKTVTQLDLQYNRLTRGLVVLWRAVTDKSQLIFGQTGTP